MKSMWLCLAVTACTSSARNPNPQHLDLALGPVDMAMRPPLPSTDGGGVPFDPAAACATATATAPAEFLPVDIIWVVDDSGSMAPAIKAVTMGLNAFAALIAGKNLDYRIVMISHRSAKNPDPTTGRYGVCIPPPLAGDANCGDGPRFFQCDADVKSTQPLEQLLGTLGQTAGYTVADSRGCDPWADHLRADATKTIVVVSDDNSRLTPDQFEHFPGGTNPYNTSTLPPGVLDPSWNHLFDHYTFDALYGWGSATDPNKLCTYSDGTMPPSSGPTYTELVGRTGGVRARICDSASSWTTFFDQVASAVSQNAQLDCNLAIPAPDGGTIDPTLVNVAITNSSGGTTLFKVANAAACTPSGGWYYDDDAHPTHVLLCPISCTAAQSQVTTGGAIKIQFGCTTIIS